MIMQRFHFKLLLSLVLLPGCGPEYHAKRAQDSQTGERLTLGTVQREIRRGMSGSEVLQALGSPNVVSTDESSNEVWVYDKFATDVVASQSGWSIVGGAIGAGNSAGGGLGVGGGGSSGAASRSQRTLTIIIKFDGEKRVRDFAYHSSRF